MVELLSYHEEDGHHNYSIRRLGEETSLAVMLPLELGIYKTMLMRTHSRAFKVKHDRQYVYYTAIIIIRSIKFLCTIIAQYFLCDPRTYLPLCDRRIQHKISSQSALFALYELFAIRVQK